MVQLWEGKVSDNNIQRREKDYRLLVYFFATVVGCTFGFFLCKQSLVCECVCVCRECIGLTLYDYVASRITT